MWQPEWVTVDDLMSEISGLHAGDRVRLITELYKVYSEFHTEPFDKFYFWGDMLLTDFDTIDKYRIDAQMLFRNISEIKEIEADISYLTPAQLQILSFWSSLGEEADLSEEKRRFLAIWKTLGPVYRKFRRRLASLGIAYNGMVQRAAADRIAEGAFAFPEPRRYVVAGFNALSECEKQLFKFLAAAAETDFYWDYDAYYKDNPEQEAGMFVRSNVALFPPGPNSRTTTCGAKRRSSPWPPCRTPCSANTPRRFSRTSRRRAQEDPEVAAGLKPAFGQGDRRGADRRKPAAAAVVRPARRYRPRERHDGFPPAAEPCLYLRRTPCGAAEPPPQKRAAAGPSTMPTWRVFWRIPMSPSATPR